MPAIGYVQRQENGGFKGYAKMVSGLRLDLDIVPNRGKTGDQPDFRVQSNGVELGGGWIKIGEVSQREYVRLSLAAPELGPRTIYVNLGRAAGQDDDDAFALIWNPAD